MAARRIWVFVAFAALVCGAEIDENELKKRGAGKTTTLNAIPTGAQKPEYTYSIYSPNPSQSNQYQTQVPNSFYPTQGVNQYYSSNPQETSTQYQQQPQINLIPPQSSSQFVPLNFVPNPGYQAKYQIIPSKNGNIQIAFIPQPQQPLHSPSVVPYPLFTPQSGQVQAQQQPFNGQFNLQNYQLPFGNPYFGHSPTMFLFPQPNPSLYNNVLYQNPNAHVHSLYNYYPGKAQAQNSPNIPPPSPEYEKIQGSVSQSSSKEENDLSVHSTEYITSSDASNYKNPYSSSHTYSKHQ